MILNKKENLKKKLIEQIEKINEYHENFFSRCDSISISKKALFLASTILEEDRILDPLDVLHFSCAICEKCDAFIYMDKKIRESDILKKYAKNNDLELIDIAIPKNQDK